MRIGLLALARPTFDLGLAEEKLAGMLARLDAITIEDLCHAAEQSAVRREIKDGIDFAI